MFRLTQHMAALRLAMAPDDRSYAKANDLSGNGTSAPSQLNLRVTAARTAGTERAGQSPPRQRWDQSAGWRPRL